MSITLCRRQCIEYESLTKPVSKDTIIPASTVKWAEFLGLVQREAKVTSVEDVPLTSLEEEPEEMSLSKNDILSLFRLMKGATDVHCRSRAVSSW